MTAVVLKTVAHHKIRNLQSRVIAGNLIKHFLCQFHLRSLVFQNDEWLALRRENHGITAFDGFSDGNLYLVADNAGRIAEAAGEIADEVLTHPFLRGQFDVFPALCVPHFGPSFGIEPCA